MKNLVLERAKALKVDVRTSTREVVDRLREYDVLTEGIESTRKTRHNALRRLDRLPSSLEAARTRYAKRQSEYVDAISSLDMVILGKRMVDDQMHGIMGADKYAGRDWSEQFDSKEELEAHILAEGVRQGNAPIQFYSEYLDLKDMLVMDIATRHEQLEQDYNERTIQLQTEIANLDKQLREFVRQKASLNVQDWELALRAQPKVKSVKKPKRKAGHEAVIKAQEMGQKLEGAKPGRKVTALEAEFVALADKAKLTYRSVKQQGKALIVQLPTRKVQIPTNVAWKNRVWQLASDNA